MIQTGFEQRVKVQQIIDSQLPEFLRSESPKSVDFLKQYYISQEYQGGPSDVAENLDQYLQLDNFTQEVISGQTTLYSGISSTTDTVQVYSTKGFPKEYGLFRIGDEIVTYTGVTTNTFTGCIRGFSGIQTYRTDLNSEELVFKKTSQSSHTAGDTVHNLSALFLKEFYKKIKYTFTPGLEDTDFVSDLDVNNFIKESGSLYKAKGTKESFKILFNVLYGVTPTVVDLERYLIKPSDAEFLKREVVVAERISGDPNRLVGQTIINSADENTKASVSEVEIFTRSGISTFYKLNLFVGYTDRSTVEGTFKVQPKVKSITKVSAGSSVITVDSTVGFGSTGVLVSGNNVITYGEKTLNQFLQCSGIDEEISVSSEIRTNEVFFGYEDGDINKKVEVRVGGVLSDFETVGNPSLVSEGQVLYVKNVGEIIKNPETDKTYKEIFANSWIYNTTVRFEVDAISGSTFTLKSSIEESSLKVGDVVDILQGSTQTISQADVTVSSINATNKQITLANLGGFTPAAGVDYTIRRKLKTASSSVVPVAYSGVTCDIQNVYNEDDENFYVASNSLPSYQITKDVKKATISSASGSALEGFSNSTLKYSILSFSSSVPFVTGDEVQYTAEIDVLDGLSERTYYVKVLSPDNKIKLYESPSFIESDTPIEFASTNSTGAHTFTLAVQKSGLIHPQRLLKKFPSSQNIKNGTSVKTVPGSTGMLINGVEISNYKSFDKIYYGPVSKVDLLSGGSDYDVINPPTVTLGNPVVSGGTTSLVRPVIRGSVQSVQVDPQDFDIRRVQSVTISGGNGTGAILQPVLDTRYREIEFDARETTDGGGIDISDDTITFLKDHKLRNGDKIVYNRNGNSEIGIGSFNASNTDQTSTLHSGSAYFAELVNTSSIKLYQTFDDYNSGINTVGFTTSVTQGVHKFRLFDGKKTLRSIKVINPGSGYENRKLIVQPTGISTVYNTITFENHGFNDGDIITYTTDGTEIGGLTGGNEHYVLKLDNNTFRLSDPGVGSTAFVDNYNRRKFIKFSSSGVGHQNFAYKDITITVNAEFDGVTGVITATPQIRGEIVDLYLYENGTGYGSTILNFHKRPNVTFKSGKDVELKPIVNGGKIVSVQVTNGGSEYTSAPDLTVVGSGVGAKLRAVVTNQKVSSVVILNGGAGYDANTSITATSVGLNANARASIRDLTVDNYGRFGQELLSEDTQGLKYNLVGYSTQIGGSTFGDDGTSHSPIIGWAYDGNPIYGPYGYANALDVNSSVVQLTTGYVQSTSSVTDRPSGFDAGFFVDDYKFNNSGNLDEYNGRFAKTPEFPNGVYAYFAGISTDFATNSIKSQFPYFIGNAYRSLPATQDVDQTFDFNNSRLRRNTFPYRTEDLTSSNDFISEPNEVLVQKATVESITKGSVDDFDIREPGSGYAVYDLATFDNTDTNGGGLGAYVQSITGKNIVEVSTSVQTLAGSLVLRSNDNEIVIETTEPHNIQNGNKVAISGVSTYIKGLTNTHTVGVSSEILYLSAAVASNATSGFVTDIYVSNVPKIISVGSTIAIGTERMSVLNVFPDTKVLRVARGLSGAGHTVSTKIAEVSNTLTIQLNTNSFDSNANRKVYFNPEQQVGIGQTAGIGVSAIYAVGLNAKSISIPTQSIYLPNHPFKTNQQVILRAVSGASKISASNTETSTEFDIPDSTSQTLFAVNKGRDYIGLSTQVGVTTNGLYFRSFSPNGDSDDYKYSLESIFNQVTAKVQKITSTVSVSTDHGLSDGDTISLSIKPNLSVGIGTSTAIFVKYNADEGKLLVNPTGFTSTAVGTATSELTITSHGFKTGEKVFYNSSDLIVSGLQTGPYYVYRVDDDTIQLSETYNDAISIPPTIVSFGSTGGAGQELSKVNPQIPVVKNNNLVFNVADSSLNGYKFKIFYDKEFKNELISVGGTITTASVSGVGTVGVGTTGVGTVTLNYSDELPSKLYYTLEKSGYISSSDTTVANYSEILFVDSSYNGSYAISGIGSTTFQVALKEVPERLSYYPSQVDQAKYSTTSVTARGGVNSLRITSGGSNYKKLPEFVSIASTDGVNADIVPQSNTIGNIKEVVINDQGFDFSADKTLSPEVYISPNLRLTDRNTITSVSVVSGGQNYVSAPDLVIVNPITGVAVESGTLEAVLQGSSITAVNVLQSPKGLSEVKNKVYAINNSNGVGIESCTSSPAGIVTCRLQTPILGFSTAPFAVGDRVFVEGIQKLGTSGDGFNSADYQYQFFPVTKFTNTNPAELEFDMSGIATNAGIAVTTQNAYATLIKESNYPTFDVVQSALEFNDGEKILTLENSIYVERDLIVTDNINDLLKVYGSYDLSVGDRLIGKISGTEATIKEVEENKAFFVVDYALRTNKGWDKETGVLNSDFQVTPDNDYYQNLSYTVKSPITYDEMIDPVNRLLHTSGLKNFSDTGITNTTSVGVGTTATATSVALIDIISENRVDTVKYFDFGLDVDTQNGSSKFVKLENKKLADYIKCDTNRVLILDDVKNLFSNNDGETDLHVDLDSISITDGYARYLIQIRSTDNLETQVLEVVTVPSQNDNLLTVEKASITSGRANNNNTNTTLKLGDVEANTDALALRFTPLEPFDTDYDIKVLKNEFNTTLTGINTRTIGFVDLVGVTTTVGVGTTVSLITREVDTTEGIFANVEIFNNITKDRSIVELYLDHDGSDTFISEYYFDNDETTVASDNFIGTFRGSINSGVLSLDYTNSTESESVLVRTRAVGFGTTSVGVGTYRFLASSQPAESENSGRLQSNFETTTGISTPISVSKNDVTTIKSIARVSYGNTSALHQLLVTHDNTFAYTMQYPFLSIGSTSGIGTFGSELSGSDLVLKFYPDAEIAANQPVIVQTYSEVIQTERDLNNVAEVLTYGPVNEELFVSGYNSRNGERSNATAFDLTHETIPVFAKTFNPASSSVLDQGTGIFTIDDHYFNTGERLIYEAGSTFTGVAGTVMNIAGSSVGLSTEVYAIRVNPNQFKLATSAANASAGTGVTFTDPGGGNAHTLEMYKKLSKSLISINGVVQSPIAFTPINYDLTNHGGTVSAATSFFSLTGISSILPGDILKVNEEYVKVEGIGIGTTSLGPITGVGNFNLVKVERGFVGSSATDHTDGDNARVYIGSYNIVKSKIHFSEPPRGDLGQLIGLDNLTKTKSSFGGRVYLRQNYDTNQVFDNISKSFTGIGQTYTVTVGGINTTGIETGSGVLFINDIFQTPTTDNNVGNNYDFIQGSAGISSVVFTGITSSNAQLILSETDINKNQLPRGGVIVSLGSTSGLGFAPLVGAAVTAVVSGGAIQSVGLGSTDIHGSGYRGTVAIAITEYGGSPGSGANVTATVGAGGTLIFTVASGGSGYTNPIVSIPSPSYENLPIIGVSRRGIGPTTDTGEGLLLTVDVGPVSTTGIGSTLFEVSSFKISRPGYAFKPGDKFKPVGLVTDAGLAAPLADFELEVLDTFSDSFASWTFGELDFIDPIASLQNGSRTRFPLYYQGELLSFEVGDGDAEIDLNAVLLIFVNGVVQEPGSHYNFSGGTSFTFTDAPKAEDQISIFFYRGTRGTDSFSVEIIETIKEGDELQLIKYGGVDAQQPRTIVGIVTSDLLETNLYSGIGVSDTTARPFNWIKQKVDKFINNDFVYKSRPSIEPLVYPTARIIGDLTSSSGEIFVDDAQFFNYEENESSIVISSVDALIINQGAADPVAAAITATVSAAGTISALTITDGGSGYVGTAITVSIAAPKLVGVGVGTTASATIPVSNGSLSGTANIINPGFGYTYTNAPKVLAPTNNVSYENVTSIDIVQGGSGIVTGITTVAGSGGTGTLGLKFFLNASSASEYSNINNGYPILIVDTIVGSGVTSVDGPDSAVVGIGTTFVDNVYIVRSFSSAAANAEFVADILSTTASTTEIPATGFVTCGRFSWGRLAGISRSSSPISIGVTGLTFSGLSTYPTIQRRSFGHRDTGALRNDLG